MGHQADHVAGPVADAGDVVDRAVGVVDVAEHHPVLVPELGQRVGVAGVVALEVVDGNAELGPDRHAGGEDGVGGSTRTATVVHRNRRPRFFCSAPGSRPASVSTWKPLQIPTTGPPSAANRPTASMTGENRAMAPGRR